MSNMALLREIIDANNARQHSATMLNARAGRAVFHVYTKAETLAFITEALAGATSAKEIADLERLRLPALDQTLVAQLEGDNITSIKLLGEIHEIDYANPVEPRILIYLNNLSAPLLEDLDDRGVFLPDGRQIALKVYLGSGKCVTSKDIPMLKQQLQRSAGMSRHARLSLLKIKP